jgi:hypothetical protein
MGDNKKLLIALAPSSGIAVYVCLYVYASFLYPGGSQQYPDSKGFSWLYNYWCDLLNPVTWYGVPNPASTAAISAQVVLCVSLILLWIIVPSSFPDRRSARWASITGVASMVTLVFLSTKLHDRVIDFAGLLSGVALLITIHQLYKMGLIGLMAFGCICLSLAGLNYLIYLTRIGIPALPFIQKITFLLTLTWFVLVNFVAYARITRK